ncbi:DUF7694 domain-containing protein [Methylobacterium iners]|uniref:DUF7694 domain-containing protein n=1 Tax=Methylobacterium iners TaxID=418707 RepID=A0ABQ4RRB1_9HYPH|nr:hypothetical protein [Methylobacterium iners]GJD92875.1 hypothetical protein OCOJLMKI_0058 [Methylobacterium iners]
MRDLRLLDAYAIRLPGCPANTSYGGCFDVPCPATGSTLRVIATALMDWDHVSVSHRKRCPNWPEMSRIKELFFRDDECAMQLHVPAADHINNHPYCLHLWRPHHVEIPRPPGEMVGIAGVSVEEARRMPLGVRMAMRERALAAVDARGGAT